MNGKGIMIWADGKRYEGDFLNDNKHGYGVYYWGDGRKYEGYWDNNK